MNQYQKKVLFIVFGILILIAIIAVFWSLFVSTGDDPSDNPNDPTNEPTNPGNTEDVFSTDISPLNDYNEFFTVSRIINDYYLEIVSQNTANVLDLLDLDYKEEMGIQANNVFDIVRSNYTSASYTPMEIYYNAQSVVTYYFVSGYLEDVDFIENTSLYYDSVNFLVIVDKNTRHYSITLLEDDIDIEEYARNYELVEKELEYNSYTQVETTEEMVLVTYLNIFRDLLFLDNERAYNMLYLDTRERYADRQDFYNHQEEIYDYIPSTIIGYSREENNDQIIYYITDSEQNRFVIYENKVMDFQISY